MTGIPAATLRIWERRYDFPKSERTEGKHRLYRRSEIDRLRWVKAKIDSGMQTRQAIRALETLDVQPLPEPTTASAARGYQQPLTETSAEADSYLHILQNRVQQTLLNHSIEEADAIFNEALALYTPEDVILNIIGPTLHNIGVGWEKGEIEIATEHLASHYLRQRLIIWMNVGPPTYDVPPTVLACAPDEYHEGGLLMFGALLRRRRWPVAYLGQSIPLEEVNTFVNQVNPSAIVIIAMTEKPASTLENWHQAMPEVARTQQPPFYYAGRIFSMNPEWRNRIPGNFLGQTLLDGVETLDTMLQSRYIPMG
jgi:DNA-binding transcriptional MerR regulator